MLNNSIGLIAESGKAETSIPSTTKMACGATIAKSCDTQRRISGSFVERTNHVVRIKHELDSLVEQAYAAQFEEFSHEKNVKQENEGFNKDEIEQLKNPLSFLENPSASSSWARSVKYSDSYALSDSKDCLSSSWVIDTDHMTNSSHNFFTYIPCPGNKKIKVAGQGTKKTATISNLEVCFTSAKVIN